MTAYRISLPIDPRATDARSAEMLEQTQRSVGMVPNMYVAMSHSPGALETYLLGYKRFRELSGLTPPEQEVVFLTISVENGCRYCVGAHSFIADNMSRLAQDVTEAIRSGAEISDPRLAALAAFTRVMFRTRGRPGEEDVRAFLGAGFVERQILDIVLAIAVKTISNYANHVFATPLDELFASRAWTPPAPARGTE